MFLFSKKKITLINASVFIHADVLVDLTNLGVFEEEILKVPLFMNNSI